MTLATLLATFMVLITFWVHYRALRWISRLVPAFPDTQVLVLAIVLLIYAVHLLEIALYAGAYWLVVEVLHIGTLHLNPLAGLPVSGFMEYLYYSAVVYTSLGLGDIYPIGHVRFLTGVEVLNGLLLIAWSGSFTFLAMGRLWPWQECRPPDSSKGEHR